MKILKSPLAKLHRQTVRLPAEAKVVAVQDQHDLCTLWVQTDGVARVTNESTFVCAFTGDELDDNLIYLGTCQFHHGATVVHVFEETQRM